MPRRRFRPAEIESLQTEVARGARVTEFARKRGFSTATLRRWTRRYETPGIRTTACCHLAILSLLALARCAPTQRRVVATSREDSATSVLARMCRTYQAMDVYVDRETLVRHDGVRGSTSIVTTRMKRPSRFYVETRTYFLPVAPPIRTAMWQIDGVAQDRDAEGAVHDRPRVEGSLEGLRGVSGFASWLVPMLLVSPGAFPCHDTGAELLGRTTIDGRETVKVRMVWRSKIVVDIAVDARESTIQAWSLAHADRPDVPYMDATVVYDTSPNLRDLRDKVFTFADECHDAERARVPAE